MLLALDIGNTTTSFCVFENKEVKRRWVIGTSLRTADELGALLTGLFSASGLELKDVDGAIACSVVPRLDAVVKESIEAYAGVSTLMVGTDVDAGVEVLTDFPAEVGSDRLVNVVAGRALYGGPLIIADLGTAATFDHVTAEGAYAGGVIAPGAGISAEALTQRAAKLPKVEPGRPERVVGRNTVECMRSGLYWGFVGLVDGIIARMLEELGGEPRVIATGGNCRLVAAESRFIKETDELLTLRGLEIIYEGKVK